MSSSPPPLSLRQPALRVDANAVIVSGVWQTRTLSSKDVTAALLAAIGKAQRRRLQRWDLSQLTALDHVGAQLLWNAWGKTRPAELVATPMQTAMFERLAQIGKDQPATPAQRFSLTAIWLQWAAIAADHAFGFLQLIGQLILDLARFAAAPLRGPWKEISASIYHAGYQALGITAIVGFLIGIVLSYLSAQQLHTFGGDIYLVDILGMSIIRELGPMLAAILVAGRSGSSITAQLGVMRVTEELDAMLVMGLPHGFRLIMPRVVALGIAMPLLVVWTDAMALIGGMTAAQLELGMSAAYFLQALPDAVPLPNYWIGLGKGVVFGCLIALVSCHFGLRIQPDTASLGRGTTTSVVTAITIVILADAVFAIVFKGVGF